MDDTFSAIASEFETEFNEVDPNVPGCSKWSNAEPTTSKPVASEFEKEFNKVDANVAGCSTSSNASAVEPTTSRTSSKTHCLLVNPKQRGNPLLKFITNVPWEYEDIVPDYQMGKTVCALFLSLRYHNLNPDYIHERLKQLKKMYELRVLLVQIDVKDPYHPLKHLTRICILADLTLMLAWSAEEAGKIIETYKIYETKPPDVLMEKSESTPYLQLIQALTTIKPINKTDAMVLLQRFQTLEGIFKATPFQLSSLPGFGTRKAQTLYKVLHEDFCK